MKRTLAILLALVLLLSMLPAASLASSQYAKVVGGWLRLRAGASYEADTITSYYTGTQVKILGKYGSWYRVQVSDGRTGYMHGDYLQLISSGSSSSASYNAYVTSHNGYGVRLRTGPGTGYRIIKTYDVGTPVTVLQSGKYWSKISIYGTVGYMMSEYLTTNPGSHKPDHVVGYATIWSRNGYGVRLRTGPGTEYGKIGTYAVGTTVAVLEKGAVWDRIRVGSRVGWMMNEFLHYHGSNEVTSVTLNTLNPVVGDVLKVQAISPSNATVRYEWKVGNGVYTGSSYTVASADVGKTIQLKVTGTGSYFGTAVSAVTQPVISNTVVYDVKLNTTQAAVGTVLKMDSVKPAGAKVNYQWTSGGSVLGTGETYTVQTGDVGKVIRLTVTGRDGYTGSDYAETAAVAERITLSGVSLTNTAPTVGDTLGFTTSPSGATVSVQWLRDGSAISGATSPAYTLTGEDKDKVISVQVSGTLAYNGTVTSAGTEKVKPAQTKPVINGVTIPELTVNVVASPVQLTASGGGTMTWGLISGSLPTGMELSSGGKISGTPTAAGTYSFTVSAANAAGTGTADLTISVVALPKAVLTAADAAFSAETGYASAEKVISITNSGNANADGVNVTVDSANFTIINGNTSIAVNSTDASWGVKARDGLAVGTYTAKVTVAYGSETTQADVTFTVTETPRTPVITTGSAADGKEGKEYSLTLSAEGTGTLEWSITGGSLPGGMSLDKDTGVISGTPAFEGEYSFTVTVTDVTQTTNNTASQTYTITVAKADPTESEYTPKEDIAPQITTESFANGTQGTPYSEVTLQAVHSGTLSWALTGGALPSGMNLDDGKISGKPTESGIFQFTLTVTVERQATNNTASRTYSLTIDPDSSSPSTPSDSVPPVLKSGSLPEATIGVSYSAALSATFANGISWEITGGALPDGLSFSDGAISGTPAAGTAGKHAFTVTITDTSNNLTDAKTFNLTVVSPSYTVSVTDGEGAGTYQQGDTVNVTASSKAGYNFTGWSAIGASVSNDTSISFTMPGNDVSLTAQYEKIKVQLSAPSVSWQDANTVTWTAVENASGYQIQIIRASGSEGSVRNVSGTSFTSGVTGAAGDIAYVWAVGDGVSYTNSEKAPAVYATE